MNTLLPFSICGWAQLALTEGRKGCSATQTGSHFSWQSHSRLEVLRRLSERERDRQREREASHTSQGGRCILVWATEVDCANRLWIVLQSQDFDPTCRIAHLNTSSVLSETQGKREPVVNNEVSAIRRLSQQTIMTFTWCSVNAHTERSALAKQRKTIRLTAPAGS